MFTAQIFSFEFWIKCDSSNPSWSTFYYCINLTIESWKHSLPSFSDRHIQRDNCAALILKLKGYFTRCRGPRCCHCKKWKYLLGGKSCFIFSVCWYLLVTRWAQSSACHFSALLPIMSAFLTLYVMGLSHRFLFISPTGSKLVRAFPLNNSMLACAFACPHLPL